MSKATIWTMGVARSYRSRRTPCLCSGQALPAFLFLAYYLLEAKARVIETCDQKLNNEQLCSISSRHEPDSLRNSLESNSAHAAQSECFQCFQHDLHAHTTTSIAGLALTRRLFDFPHARRFAANCERCAEHVLHALVVLMAGGGCCLQRPPGRTQQQVASTCLVTMALHQPARCTAFSSIARCMGPEGKRLELERLLLSNA